jgi:hypothetical protein
MARDDGVSTFEQERVDECVVERDACWVDLAESPSYIYPRQVKHSSIETG